MPDNTMSIALLSQAGESGSHLRAALAESGTPIVYESQAADFDRDALEESGARVVVVSLDPEVEAHLDDVYALLDDERYNVIFDESQVSSQLSGWEQARWARHLAAKILGVDNADPPRPEGAEAVPNRSVPPVSGIARATPHDAPPSVAELAVAERPAREPVAAIDEDPVLDVEVSAILEVAQQQDETSIEDDDFADIARLLAEPEFDSIGLPSAEPIPAAVSAGVEASPVAIPELDLSEFDNVDEIPSAPMDAGDEVVDTIEMSEFDLDLDLRSTLSPALEDVAPSAERVEPDESVSALSDDLGFGDLDDFADADDLVIETIELDSSVEAPPVSVESDLAESLENGEVAAAGAELADLQLLDLDLSDEPQSVPSEEEEGSSKAAQAPVFESAFAWELESSEDDDGNASAGTNGKTSAPAKFGIETISASDFLAPEAEQEADDTAAPELSLELIPLEEAVAPGASHSSFVETESWLDTNNKTAVSRVWVLGASIGGPEAVREFLAEIPANCPALFLLAQHMGAEFMDIMAQQLVRSTKLTVRTPSHGERVSHGDLLIVPITHRIRVDRAGVVTLESLPSSDRQNLPSIDQVLKDVADRFGAKAGAIIFSGMAEDAIEGSRYLTEIGGAVFAQDPETCVISSMVDGVVETGVVSFIGSPKALAGKLLEVLGSTTKS